MDIQELDSGVPGDYINMRNVNVRRENGGHPLKCIVLAFGLLCILQATLNISLRLYPQTGERQEVMNITGEHAKHGWLYFNNAFYFISSSTKTWTDSRIDCLQRNADLVVINSREEQEFITRWHGYSASWIGLSMQGPQGIWQWVDGTNITLSFWGVGEPNSVSHDEDCAQIWNGVWVDNGCFKEKPWVCETNLTTQKEEDPSRPGWERFGSSLYHFAFTQRTWEDSQNDCRRQNADLVIINSKEEEEFIRSKIREQCWIGLSDRETEGEWKWVDGSHITFENWGTNEPDGLEKKEECAETRWRTRPNLWNDAICDKSNFWICEKVAGTPLLEGDLKAHNSINGHSRRSLVAMTVLLLVVAMFIL